MKPVFKCEYCNFMGTEDQVKEHEERCFDNYDKKSCMTCKNKSFKTITQFECKLGVEIPEGKQYEFCPKYERKEKSNNDLGNIFCDMFGGFK